MIPSIANIRIPKANQQDSFPSSFTLVPPSPTFKHRSLSEDIKTTNSSQSSALMQDIPLSPTQSPAKEGT